MASRPNFVSILNNDDHPSFTVRSSPRLIRHHSSSSFDPVTESGRAPSPGSSVCSYDYATSSCGSYFQPNPSSASDSYFPPSSSTALSEHVRSATSPDPPSPSSINTFKDSPSTSTISSFPSSNTTTTAPTASAKRGVRKNKYPCPYAASHNCSSTFTTSGHAARHGKKHTGEKSVHCPICNKAFTRKDNMKQHIRTHRNHSEENTTPGAGAGTGRESGASTPTSGWSARKTSPPAYHQHQHQHHRSISQSEGREFLSVRHAPY